MNVQLPFYASVLADASGAEVAGLVLAQIHARQVAAQGLADVDLGMAGVTLAEDSKYFDGLSGRDPPALARGDQALADEYAAGVAPTWPIAATT